MKLDMGKCMYLLKETKSPPQKHLGDVEEYVTYQTGLLFTVPHTGHD